MRSRRTGLARTTLRRRPQLLPMPEGQGKDPPMRMRSTAWPRQSSPDLPHIVHSASTKPHLPNPHLHSAHTTVCCLPPPYYYRLQLTPLPVLRYFSLVWFSLGRYLQPLPPRGPHLANPSSLSSACALSKAVA